MIFNIIEFVAFILPAFVCSFNNRLLLLILYFIGHKLKLNYKWKRFKDKIELMI